MVFAAALVLLDFRSEELQWRAEREANLKKPTGWLAVAGLHWLKPGMNQIGFGTDIEIRTAEGTVEWQAGDKFRAKLPNGGRTPEAKDFDSQVELNEKLYSGEIVFSIIHRGDRHGLRVWDPKAATRVNFKGLSWFPPRAEYVVNAKFVAYKTVRQLSITNILGYSEPSPNPGYFSFMLRGKKCRLEAIDEGETYFLNFKDRTSGATTYPAGRFIDLPKRSDGKYMVNFNRAYNPPCAFTNFATCPLPPKGNLLNVAIEAGEKTHHAN
ncbi:MAG: DUF1684 domain-containing protein [Armatimonadota bacterium]